MKRFQQLSFLLACLVMSIVTLQSCEFDTPPDPDHPLFVTYSISASYDQIVGPETLQTDVKKWIQSNQLAYDREINYNSSDPTVFETDDAEALVKYEAYMEKFNAFIIELKKKLDSGTYGEVTQVNIPFVVYCKRSQGANRTLKSESIPFVYPATNH